MCLPSSQTKGEGVGERSSNPLLSLLACSCPWLVSSCSWNATQTVASPNSSRALEHTARCQPTPRGSTSRWGNQESPQLNKWLQAVEPILLQMHALWHRQKPLVDVFWHFFFAPESLMNWSIFKKYGEKSSLFSGYVLFQIICRYFYIFCPKYFDWSSVDVSVMMPHTSLARSNLISRLNI